MDSWDFHSKTTPTDTSQFAKFVNNAADPLDVREQQLREEEAEAKRSFDRLTEQMEFLTRKLKETSRARDAVPALLLKRRTMKRVSAVLGVSTSRIGQMKQRFVKEQPE